MEIISTLFQILFAAIFIYLTFSGGYFFIFSIAGLFYKDPKGKGVKQHHMAVMIPGYKEDSVIIDVAKDALRQDYPQQCYDVIVIADSFTESTLSKLRELPIKVLEVSFENSTKSKSINKAFEQLPENYDLVVILDADNQMERTYLSQVNRQFDGKTKIVQTHRIAKNLNNNLAILDAISEEMNNHAFRKGHRVLGLSAALIGSGMAFEYNFFKDHMAKIKAIGGFDKELELKFTSEGEQISYLNSALVFDEKVQKSQVFTGQRRRWLSAQFLYFARSIGPAFLALLTKGNIDYFNKSIQMALMPRVLLIGLTFILALLSLLLNILPVPEWIMMWIYPGILFWQALFAMVVVAVIAAIPHKFYNFKTLQAVLSLPKGFLLMARSLISIGGANKKFIHTQHGQTN
ncbi:MAG TPA: glycosyltransferase [Bacteroidales bacterium]|mgnify:CR=1 FL=1|nr:glycosyltransferase [Bacteroidales bacterium]HRX97529.1 glycosyltransferase [Bacteroidales bacterium]